MKSCPYSLESVWLSVISFDEQAKQLMPLTELVEFEIPDIQIARSESKNLGAGLRLALQCMKKETQERTFDHRGDYCPNIFIFTNGTPTDSWLDEAKAIKDSTRRKQRVRGKGLEFVVCTEASDPGVFKGITEVIIHPKQCDAQVLLKMRTSLDDELEPNPNSLPLE
ncbi:MAG: hypothetical protein HN548_07700 [Opitutae bacterium]|nr:hypothetical protein [Opitutae bacterium]